MPKTEPTEPKLQSTLDDPIIIDSDSDCDLPPVKKPHSPAKCPVIKESQEEFLPIQVSDVQVIPNSQPLQVPPQVPLQVPPEVPLQVPPQVPHEVPLQVPPEVPPQVPLQVLPKKKVTFPIKKDDSPAEPMSPDVSPDVSPDTTPKVPPNSPVSSQPDVLLTQRLVQVKIYLTFHVKSKKNILPLKEYVSCPAKKMKKKF